MSKKAAGGNKKKSSASRKSRTDRHLARRPVKKLKAVLWHGGVAAAQARAKTFIGGEAALARLLPAFQSHQQTRSA